MRLSKFSFALSAFVAVASLAGMIEVGHADQTLLNVSYDPTRELFTRITTPPLPSTGRRKPAKT